MSVANRPFGESVSAGLLSEKLPTKGNTLQQVVRLKGTDR